MAADGAYEPLAASLMQHHYDPRYEKQRGRFDVLPHTQVALDSLAPDALAAAAPDLARAVLALSAG